MQRYKIKCIRISDHIHLSYWLSGRVLVLRPKGRGLEPHRRHCVVSLSKNINPGLVRVQHRKTRPFITERLLMGRKESNQTKTNKIKQTCSLVCFTHRVGEGSEDEEDNDDKAIEPVYRKIQTFNNPNYGSTGKISSHKLSFDGEANGDASFETQTSYSKQSGINGYTNPGMDQSVNEAAIVAMQDISNNDFISKLLM